VNIPTEKIKELRGMCGAGIMDCRNALIESGGDIERALQCLKEKGFAQAEKRVTRSTKEGLVEAYIHIGQRIGAMVEVNCETDFVARTNEFKELAHNLAMQVAATSPKHISKEELPEGSELEPETACLLLQPYIKAPEMFVQDVIKETIAKLGENIRVKRFARFEIGE